MFSREYPNLDLYAYDVCNEVINDGTANQGGKRDPGINNGRSPWVQVYGSNGFVEKAFTYARKYAPKTCKLYYNDYNEFAYDKKNCIKTTILKPLFEKGLLDGMGMQSHISAAASNAWGDTNSYLAAMDDYLSLGIDVQVTELDISTEGGKFSLDDQAKKYKAIFQHAVDVNKSGKYKGKVTLMQVWGPNDGNSWVGTDKSGRSNAPLLYDRNNQAKPAYSAIQSIIPDSAWKVGIPYTGPGSSGYTPVPAEPVKPDANGYYFHHTFESDTNSWTGRGGASVSSSSNAFYAGSKSLFCSDRSASWNGASFTINANPFEPGKAFSFSADVCALDGADTTDFKFTLQYDGSDGETHYDEIASGTAPKGAWLQLANTNYTIPEGASNMLIYVETSDDSTGNFYVDEVVGAVAGTKIAGPDKPIVRKLTLGDLTFDGVITSLDVVLARRGIVNGINDALALRAADTDQNGKFELADLVLIQNFVLGRIKEFPEPEVVKPDISRFTAAFNGVTAASSWKQDGENNPMTTQRFGADPGWMVYKDRLYIYTTNDAFEYKNDGRMQENTYNSGTINCVSTSDMVNWTDHGAIPVAARNGRTKNGAASWAFAAWAPDAAWKTINGKDKFFLYFANSGGGIGVLTADSPVGPWKDPLGHALLTGASPNCSDVVWMFDPGVYYDPTTDEAYLFFGGGRKDGVPAATPGTGRVVKLGKDMISLDGNPVKMETPYLFEDSSVIKIGDTWYYSYCANWNVPGGNNINGVSFGSADIVYMTSKNPLGPWGKNNVSGMVFANTGSQRLDNGGNNHHSIIYFKDKYYVAYHSRQQAIRMVKTDGLKIYNNRNELSADGNYRSTCINEASFNNGKLSCKGDTKGCSQLEKLDVFSKVQAETMSNQSRGITVDGLYDTTVKGKKGDWIKVSGADFTKAVKSITAKGSGGMLKFTTGKVNGDVIGYIDLSAGGEQTLGAISSPTGTQDVYIEFSGDVTLDYWFFS
jgi:arabinoxylan arabinofuranohydrolase